MIDENRPRLLPTYKGWTVDFRLGEFRKVVNPDPGDNLGIVFLGFSEPEAQELLYQMMDDMPEYLGDIVYSLFIRNH